MTGEQLAALGPALATFMERWVLHGTYAPTFEHMRTYVRGLLSDLPRKTVEPIALAAGTPARTLQEFLRDHLGSAAEVRNDIQTHVAHLLTTLPDDGRGTVGLLDETSVPKKGTKTPGVGRQYLGCMGKVDDGIVTVHLGVCRGTYNTLLDADLFLPKDWSDDRTRCRAAEVPEDMVHRPKWRIALDQLGRARANGVHLDWLTFDGEYGRCPAFLAELDARSQSFVGDAPRRFSCLAAGKTETRPEKEIEGQAAEDVVRNASVFRSQKWRVVRLSLRTAEDQLWRVTCARVWASGEAGWSSRTYWPIWACSEKTGEEKFLVSNASAECPLERMVRVAWCRANVEHAFRICKSELGFTHFEGRNYTALMRHLGLCVATMAFVAEHTLRLRGEKPTGDGGAGVPGLETSEPRMAGPVPRDRRAGVGVGGHRVPPAPQPGRNTVQTKTRRSTTHTQKTEKTKAQTISCVKVAL